MNILYGVINYCMPCLASILPSLHSSFLILFVCFLLYSSKREEDAVPANSFEERGGREEGGGGEEEDEMKS